MKNRKVIISLIVILAILAILLTIFFVGLLNHNFNFSFLKFSHKVSNKLVLDEEYNIDFNSITIEAEASDIYIKTSKDNTSRVILYGKEENTIVETDNNELKIQSKEKGCIGFCFNFEVAKIEVYLPENYDKEISMHNKYGDIEIAEFINANLSVEEDYGDVFIHGGNIVNVSNKFGDITINKSNILNIDEKAGNVEIGTVNEVKVNNSYGDIKINSINHSLNLQNNCGDIKIDNIDLKENSYIKDDLGNIKIGRTNEIYIDVKTSLGDTEIQNNYNQSSITLKIENDCGDIEVNN